MGYLRRGKWIRDEKFVSGRGECVCLERHVFEDVPNLRFVMGVERSAVELVLGFVAQISTPWSWRFCFYYDEIKQS